LAENARIACGEHFGQEVTRLDAKKGDVIEAVGRRFDHCLHLLLVSKISTVHHQEVVCGDSHARPESIHARERPDPLDVNPIRYED